MADDMAEFYAHKIQERNLAVLERLQTRLRFSKDKCKR